MSETQFPFVQPAYRVDGEDRWPETGISCKEYSARAIRLAMDRDAAPGPCFICEKWQGLTVQHHVVPVAKAAAASVWEDSSAIMLCVNSVLWLCPNHHALIHAPPFLRNDVNFLSQHLSEEDTTRWRALVMLETKLAHKLVMVSRPR